MLWSKQFYYYVVEEWLKGDPAGPPPPESRQSIRNHEWIHLFNDDILSMPDKWEYPWFAAWYLAFHVIPLAIIDPDFAKRQLQRLTREWYMHPNSNWRGPIWLPMNYLIIESLQRFYQYLGDDFKVECPTGSGVQMNLNEVAVELSKRLGRIFVKDESGRRPVYRGMEVFQTDPHWRELILFHEYFNAETLPVRNREVL